MRHRLIEFSNGLGNPEKVRLDNTGRLDESFADAVLSTYLPQLGSNFKMATDLDFKVEEDKISIGYEPAYQSQRLFIITINKDKGLSSIERGYAFGPYGSEICSKTKYYKDYKLNSKFKRFVDQWYPVLFQGGK